MPRSPLRSLVSISKLVKKRERLGGGGPGENLRTHLDGLHGVVLIQLVDVVGDAGVERHGRDGVDDGGVVRLLLVALAVRVDEQRDQAAQDGAAEANGDHVEQVEVCRGEEERRSRFTLQSTLLPVNLYVCQTQLVISGFSSQKK